jgi:hypothetical protein
MGLDPSAALVYGVLVQSHDYDTGEPTALWSDDDSDWRWDTLPEPFDLHTYGYFDSADGDYAVLTLKSVKPVTNYQCEAVEVPTLRVDPLLKFEAVKQAEESGLPSFKDARWWLVGSYG